MFLANDWVLGIGPGNADYLIDFSTELHVEDRLWRLSIDSYFLIRLIESGVISFSILILLFGCYIFRIFKMMKVNGLYNAIAKYMIVLSGFYFIISALFTVMPIYFLITGYLLGRCGNDNRSRT